MPGQTGRAVQAADGALADAHAQEGEEAADVVDVGMADEDVRHLVCKPGRQARTIAEIEEKAAALMPHADVQQRISEDPVHELHIDGPNPGG